MRCVFSTDDLTDNLKIIVFCEKFKLVLLCGINEHHIDLSIRVTIRYNIWLLTEWHADHLHTAAHIDTILQIATIDALVHNFRPI